MNRDADVSPQTHSGLDLDTASASARSGDSVAPTVERDPVRSAADAPAGEHASALQGEDLSMEDLWRREQQTWT